jgi:hypothetical protein
MGPHEEGLMDGIDDFERPRHSAIDGLIRRIPPEAWPFLVIAVLLVIQSRALIPGGPTDLFSWLLLATLVLEVLVPASIFLGCRDAWTSARLVLVGAIVWTTFGSVLFVVVAAEQWLIGNVDNSSLNSIQQSFAGNLDRPLSSLISIARSLAGIASYAGPLIVVFGLARRRRSVTIWPAAVVVVAVTAAIAVGLWQGRTTLDSITTYTFPPAGLSATDMAHVVREALSPAYLLSLGALAWSCLSAVRAG